MKGRKHKESGGPTGVDEAKEDSKTKPEARTDAKKIDSEAEEMKKGGRAKKARGGKMEHKAEGESKHHMGRKPRKNGGRTGSDSNPFTSARMGKAPKGHAQGPTSQ